MMLKLRLMREVKEKFGIIAILVEIYRVVMKTATLIYNFWLTFGGVILWRGGELWSALTLIVGSALIFLFALKDHSEDRIYEWSVKKHHNNEHLLLTTVILYGVIMLLQTLVLLLSDILKNI